MYDRVSGSAAFRGGGKVDFLHMIWSFGRTANLEGMAKITIWLSTWFPRGYKNMLAWLCVCRLQEEDLCGVCFLLDHGARQYSRM